jgi:hypothetical protein
MYDRVIKIPYNPSSKRQDLEIGSSVIINEKVNKGAEKMIGMKGVLKKIYMCVDVPCDALTIARKNTYVYVLVFPGHSADEKTLVDAETKKSLRKTPELRKFTKNGEYWVKSLKCLSLAPDIISPERTEHVDDTFPKKSSEELVVESQARFYAKSKERMELILQKFAPILQEDKVEDDPFLYANEDWVEPDVFDEEEHDLVPDDPSLYERF